MATMVGFDALARRVDALQRDLDPERMLRMQVALGENAQRLAAREASADLKGDRAFSGWTKLSPIPLDTKWRALRDGAVSFSPTRSSAGPWTVAERGRNQGTGSITPNFGAARGTSRISAKTGKAIKGRARKVKRWNGRTDGKGTAARTVAAIERTTPPIVDRHVVIVARKHFDVD